MCDYLYKAVFLKDSEQFVGIIKGEVFHSHSILDMGKFFDENPKYEQGVMECLFDGINVRLLVFCNDDELFKIRDEIRKQNVPFLMEFYQNALKEEAETIIQADIEEEEEEDDFGYEDNEFNWAEDDFEIHSIDEDGQDWWAD